MSGQAARARPLLLWTLLAAAGAAVLVAGAWPREPDAASAWDAPDTTYSPGPRGTKALFLLLSQEGLDARRLRRPAYDRLPAGAGLWDLAPEALGPLERRWLLAFVRAGGTFVAGPGPFARVAQDAGLGKPSIVELEGALTERDGLDVEAERAWSIAGVGEPAEVDLWRGAESTPVAAAWPVGRGRLVFLGIPDAARDDQIGRGDNGPFFLRLARASGSTLFFDEFQTGFGDEGLLRLLAAAPYRWGLAQGALALAVLLLAFGRRRWPAEAPVRARRRRTGDQVAALARFWAAGGDAGLPLDALLRAASDRARTRLGGVPPSRPEGGKPPGGPEAFADWVAAVRPEAGERARRLWASAAALAASNRPSLSRARELAAELARLESEVLAW